MTHPVEHLNDVEHKKYLEHQKEVEHLIDKVVSDIYCFFNLI